MTGSHDIRRAPRPVHREDVVAAARDVVAPPRSRQTADIRGVEGFRIDGPDGRIGTVTSVSSSTPGAPPDTIQVMTGLFIVRVVPVAAAEILQVDDDRRRILIRTMLRRPRTPHVPGMLRRFLASSGAQ
ncbi:MAG TPA: hypothetical protein VLB81_15435 [Gaiellales bacterium]|nr:hypothetical protein [Gaiellales bacterium]